MECVVVVDVVIDGGGKGEALAAFSAETSNAAEEGDEIGLIILGMVIARVMGSSGGDGEVLGLEIGVLNCVENEEEVEDCCVCFKLGVKRTASSSSSSI